MKPLRNGDTVHVTHDGSGRVIEVYVERRQHWLRDLIEHAGRIFARMLGVRS